MTNNPKLAMPELAGAVFAPSNVVWEGSLPVRMARHRRDLYGGALGRSGRYGMTPSQQRLYVGLAARGKLTFRHQAAMAITGGNKSTTHELIQHLVERGWVEIKGLRYKLTKPVMTYRLCREVAS